MKVLFVSERYYPEMNGVANVVSYLAKGLSRQGHEVHVVTKGKQGINREDKHDGVMVHRFYIQRNRFFKVQGEKEEYLNFFKNNIFDVIIFECTQSVFVDFLLKYINTIPGRKILHSHGFSGLSLKPFKIYKTIKETVGNFQRYMIWRYYYYIILKKEIKRFDKIILLADTDVDYQYVRKYYNGIFQILPNAVEDIFFEKVIDKSVLSKYAFLQNKEYYISVANYSSVKNQRGILLEYYLSKTEDVSMIFIGSEKNSYYEKLIQDKLLYDKKYGYREVLFLTDVKRNDIPGVIKGAKVYLTGSTRETFSVSLIEAMAVETAFISTNVGNAKELPGGLVLHNSRIKGMHYLIDKICANDKLRKSLACKGGQYANRYCRVNNIVMELERIISVG